jgi:hypothetical protein
VPWRAGSGASRHEEDLDPGRTRADWGARSPCTTAPRSSRPHPRGLGSSWRRHLGTNEIGEATKPLAGRCCGARAAIRTTDGGRRASSFGDERCPTALTRCSGPAWLRSRRTPKAGVTSTCSSSPTSTTTTSVVSAACWQTGRSSLTSATCGSTHPQQRRVRGIKEGQALAELLGAPGIALPWSRAFGGRHAVTPAEQLLEVATGRGSPRLTLLSPTPDRLARLFKVWERELAKLAKRHELKVPRPLTRIWRPWPPRRQPRTVRRPMARPSPCCWNTGARRCCCTRMRSRQCWQQR